MAMQNVVAATLRMRNTAVRTARDLKHEVRDTGREAQKMGTKFGHAIKASRTSVSGLMGSFVSLRTIIAATFAYRAVQRFGTFLKSLTELYKQQEDATRILGESLAGWNNYSREMVQQLHEQATAMQAVVNVDNEEIESMMALLASYGMTGDKIKETIGLTIDFAKAKRIELKAAVDLIGKAFVGYTGTLSRYGIILDRNLTKEEKYAATLKAISSFTGLAAGITETYSGQVGVLGKAYDDMKKEMGAVLAAGIEQSGMLDMLGAGIENVTNWLVKWEPLLSDLAAGGMKRFRDAILELEAVSSEGNLVRWFFTVGNAISVTSRAFTVWFRVVLDGLSNISDLISTGIVGWTAFFTTIVKGASAAKTAISILVQGVADLREAVRHPLTHSLDVFKDVKRETKEDLAGISDAWKKWLDAMDTSIESSWERRMKSQAKNEETIAALKKDFADLKFIWEAPTGKDFLDRLGEKLEKANETLRLHRKAQQDADDAMKKGIQNRGALNNKIAETIKLTQSMARQYALASRVEQEQIKFLLAKAKDMVPEDVLGLTKMEKKLISSQGVLKERYKDLMSVFAKKELKLELEDKTALDRLHSVMSESLSLRHAERSEQEKQLDLMRESIWQQEQLNRLKREEAELYDIGTEQSKSVITDSIALIESKNSLLSEQWRIVRELEETRSKPVNQDMLDAERELLVNTRNIFELYELQTAEQRKQSEWLDKHIMQLEEINRLKEEATKFNVESTLELPNAESSGILKPDFSSQLMAPSDIQPRDTQRKVAIDINIGLTDKAAELLRVIEENNKMSQRHNFERAVG